MSHGDGDVDSTFLEALVEVILEIQQYAERGRLRPGGTQQFDPHVGIDVAGSIHDPNAVPDPVGPTAVARDGGDYRFTARETEEGLLVVGDLREMPGSCEETEVDLGEDSLILTIDDRIVSRVPVDDGWTTISEVSVNNDVLKVRVRIRK